MNNPTKQSHMRVRAQLRVGWDNDFKFTEFRQCDLLTPWNKCRCQYDVRKYKNLMDDKANAAEKAMCDLTTGS